MSAAYIQDAIMLLGDSLTEYSSLPQGLAQQLSYVYNRKLDVLNRGFSGYNTNWAVPVFEQILAKGNESKDAPKVRLLTIWFGANDSCIPGTSPQHVPIPEFIANITKLIHMISSPASPYYSPGTKIILLTPPPVDARTRAADLTSRNPPRLPDRKFEVTEKYAEAVREVGRNKGLPVVDVYRILWDACGKQEENLKDFLYDGLHVNGKAYQMIYDEIINVISERYPELHYDNLPTVFPPWDQVDPQNYIPALKKRIIF